MRPQPARILVAVLGLLCTLAGALSAAVEDYPRRFGKTNEQILAMGYQRWMDWQGTKAGQSTAGMNEGMAAYRAALRSRNDRLARRAAPRLRSQVAALRPLLERFASANVDVGYFLTGGGTLWSNVHSDSMVQVESTLHALLSGKGLTAKPHTTGQVLRALSKMEPFLGQVLKDSPERKAEHAAAVKALKQARADFNTLAAVTAGLDRRRSDQVLSFCLDRIDMAATEAGPG